MSTQARNVFSKKIQISSILALALGAIGLIGLLAGGTVFSGNRALAASLVAGVLGILGVTESQIRKMSPVWSVLGIFGIAVAAAAVLAKMQS